MAGPPDVFNVDVKSVQAASEAVRDFAMSAEKSADQMRQVRDAMNMVAEARNKMSSEAFTIIDPTSKAAVEGLTQDLLKAGVPMAAIIRMQKQWADYSGKIIIDSNKLTNAEERFCKVQKKKLDAERTYTNYHGQLIKLGDRQQINQSKLVKSFGAYGRHVKGIVSSMASVDLSLMGIIALLIEAHNTVNKIAGLSGQAAAHWGGGNKELQAANKNIYTMWGRFRKTVDESGAYIKSLGASGLQAAFLNDEIETTVDRQKLSSDLAKNKLIQDQKGTLFGRATANVMKDQATSSKTIYGLSSLILANEIKFGLSASEQVKNIKGLVNNFNLSEKAAYGMLSTVRDSAIELKKTGTAISMEEVISDWTELADKTKVYNTDLLGTLSLYNSLMSKDVAKTLGLGEVPMSVRRQISKTFAGMSNELSDGWKAALGTGTSAAAKILNFESLMPEEQFRKVATFISTHVGGDIEGGIIQGRKILEQLGFSKEEQKVLSEAVLKKGLTGGGIDKAVAAIKVEREKAKGIAEKEQKARDALIKSASNIATNLQSTQAYLKQWVEEHVIGVLKDLIDAINELIDAFKPGDKLEKIANLGSSAMIGGKIMKAGAVTRVATETAYGKQLMAEQIEANKKVYKTQMEMTGISTESPTGELSPYQITQIGRSVLSKAGEGPVGLDTLNKTLDLMEHSKGSDAIALLNKVFKARGLIKDAAKTPPSFGDLTPRDPGATGNPFGTRQ